MTSQYFMHFVLRKNILYYVISFRKIWYVFRKPQCGDPEHRITLCEINGIKTDNIDGYIINIYYYNRNLIRSAESRQVDKHGSLVIRACQRF